MDWGLTNLEFVKIFCVEKRGGWSVIKTFPESRLGKWAIGMTLTCVLLLVIFFLFMAIGLVDFNTGHWWDITIGIAVPIELLAFVLSIISVKKERTVLIYCSLILGIMAVIFLLTHSLYIHDWSIYGFLGHIRSGNKY